MRELWLGTRASALARRQSQAVARRLGQVHPSVRIREALIASDGDHDNAPLAASRIPGIFVAALRQELCAGRVDFLVHSLKDLPADDHPDLVIAAIPAREDARDALVTQSGSRLACLPAGATVGTSSPRRKATLARRAPWLELVEIRGNVDTRLAKLRRGEYDGVVLALAGLRRLGRETEATEIFELTEVIPAPGQGALAIECRADDLDLRRLLAPLSDSDSLVTATAERAVLRGLRADCTTPIGAVARVDHDGLTICAELSTPDGSHTVRCEKTAPLVFWDASANNQELDAAETLGRELGAQLRAHPIASMVTSR